MHIMQTLETSCTLYKLIKSNARFDIFLVLLFCCKHFLMLTNAHNGKKKRDDFYYLSKFKENSISYMYSGAL